MISAVGQIIHETTDKTVHLGTSVSLEDGKEDFVLISSKHKYIKK